MASETLTDYERRRLENIRRNNDMMSALMLKDKAVKLLKPARTKKPGSAKRKPEPVAIRRSDRTRGIPPPSFPSTTTIRDPFPIADAFRGLPGLSDSDLLSSIRSARAGAGPAKGDGFDPRRALVLRPENVVLRNIMSVRFLPAADRTVVVLGSHRGHLGFWDVDGSGDGDRFYVFGPHTGPVSGISVHPFSLRKIFTSSYDGHIRLMDIEKGNFNVICSSDFKFFSICQWPHDINSLYMGEWPGIVKVWDERQGKASSEWKLHGARINTIDFNPGNWNFMATSSSDGTACIWDLRSVRKDRPESLKSFHHLRPVHSAYFSPNGSHFAITSYDNCVGILSGPNFDNQSIVLHDNSTNKGAIWGWDDSYLFIGSKKGAVHVISTVDGTITALQSPHMTSNICRFAAHPYHLGSLAGTTDWGTVYLWTRK